MKASLSHAFLSLALVSTLLSPVQAQTPVDTFSTVGEPVFDPGIAAWVIGATSVTVALADQFLGNTKRQCTASYRVTVLDSHDAIDTFEAGLFASIGGCGKTVPDRCRRRARDRAHECMKAHWDTRGNEFSPAQCAHSEDAIYNYGVTKLDSYLKASVCQVRAAGNYNVRVEAVTRGNTGCNSTQILANTYQVSCP